MNIQNERQLAGINRNGSRIVDGHTHSELCPHGSGDRTALMIEKAIELRIERICLTEHAPLPESFKLDYIGDLEAINTASIQLNQVDTYLELGRQLQRTYGNHIDISIGFEIDYLPGFEAETRDFLNRYGPLTEENILSVHFMEGINDGFWCIDYSEEEFGRAFAPWLQNQSELYFKYFSLVRQAVRADFGTYTPQRIGHFDLIKKYQKHFGFSERLDRRSLQVIRETLQLIRGQGRELDYNFAGLFKTNCGEMYPSRFIQGMVYAMGVPFVTGSDAHGVKDLEKVWAK